MTPAAGGFRPLRVLERRAESSTICSFVLQPADGQAWRPFQAGQFLTLRLPCDTAPTGFVLRNYSVSSSPADTSGYRISVKHEAGRPPDIPAGLGSSWMHERVQVGQTLDASGPHGAFTLDGTSTRPVLLVSGGVGLTPLVSMLHVLATTSQRAVWFIHACDNGAVHAFRDEVKRLAALRPGITVATCYRFPTDADRRAGHHQAEGLVQREQLQAWLPLDDYEAYLCGPPAFMQAQYTLLRSLGIQRERIAFEFFGPASVLSDSQAAAPTVTAAAAAPAHTASQPVPRPAGSHRVLFSASGRSVDWLPGSGSLLDLAEGCGLAPSFSCRAGVCGTCVCDLVAGEVEYLDAPLDDPGPGRVLPCCARPRGDVTLKL